MCSIYYIFNVLLLKQNKEKKIQLTFFSVFEIFQHFPFKMEETPKFFQVKAYWGVTMQG